ncbi:hypothetical protein [Mesorhizobium metallidurans]|nr:hypothetical protein [Mesorhizobium metallidurans]
MKMRQGLEWAGINQRRSTNRVWFGCDGEADANHIFNNARLLIAFTIEVMRRNSPRLRIAQCFLYCGWCVILTRATEVGVMAREVEFQDDDVLVTSRNPLKGTLLLITDDDDEVELQLDKETAEALMSALGAFLMEGVVGPL